MWRYVKIRNAHLLLGYYWRGLLIEEIPKLKIFFFGVGGGYF